MGDLPVGTLVRLVDLKRAEFNHHVGRVVTPAGRDGRLGVSLHASVFPDAARGGRGHPPASFRPENLRRAATAGPGSSSSALDSVPARMICRMLGERGRGLPGSLAEHIAGHLRVWGVAPDEVSVAGSSSQRGDCPLGAALNAREDEWWISGAGTMPRGVGREFLEFSFGGQRRVSYVAVKIPPLPQGPLSVRDFHLLALRPGEGRGAWVEASPPLQTLDRGDLQEFALVPPLEAERARLVCTRNAAALGGPATPWSPAAVDCVGLFQVTFA